MTMDAREQFPVDMVEQMLKFTPSPEERALLDEHAEEIDHLARADRFLFELSKWVVHTGLKMEVKYEESDKIVSAKCPRKNPLFLELL